MSLEKEINREILFSKRSDKIQVGISVLLFYDVIFRNQQFTLIQMSR